MQLLKGLKLLEDSYRSKNWEGIKESYFLISGEELSEDIEALVKPKRGRPTKVANKLEKIKDKLAKQQPNPSNFKANIKEENKPKKESFQIEKIRKTPKTSEVRFKGNTFVDNGKLHAADRKFDAKYKDDFVRQDPRPAHEYVELPCDTKGCSETVQVDPSLYLSDTSYYCNECLVKKARR